MALSGDPASSLDPARKAIELARRLAEPDLVAQGLNHLAMSLMRAGEDAALGRARRCGRRGRCPDGRGR